MFEQMAEDVEIAGDGGRAMQRPFDTALLRPCEPHLERERDLQRPFGAASQPHGGGGHDRCRHRDRDPSHPERLEQRRRFRPRHQLVAVHARSDVGPGKRDGFAQIQEWRALGDSLLPRGDLRRHRRCGQPAGKLRLAGACAGDGQQLEERPVTEQVEVVRVQMAIVAKALARFTRALPAVLDPSQSTLVERNRPGRAIPLADHQFVFAHQDDEGGYRQQKEPDAQDLPPGQQQHQRRDGRDPQPPIAELAVCLRQALVGRAPRGQPDAIHLSGLAVHAYSTARLCRAFRGLEFPERPAVLVGSRVPVLTNTSEFMVRLLLTAGAPGSRSSMDGGVVTTSALQPEEARGFVADLALAARQRARVPAQRRRAARG